MSAVLYNEIEPYAAQWLENLSSTGHIAPGRVEQRSVAEITAQELDGVTQFHTFAGIGVWSAALRAAGWPDDCPVWTGSCPCQPFSQAGRGRGVADERHLWPEWFRLIRECRPPIVLGEQVASPAGLGWLDAVFADLEGAGYACAAADLCAASVGAPHIRQRLYFVAIADGERLEGVRIQLRERGPQPTVPEARGGGEVSKLDEYVASRNDRRACELHGGQPVDYCAYCCDLADASKNRRRQGREDERRSECGNRETAGRPGSSDDEHARALADAECDDGPGRIAQPHGRSPIESDRHGTAGFWYPADWIACRDGKARPVEPGTFPLAHGAPARVGRLRAYGNAIVRPQAQAFIEVVMDMLASKGVVR